MDRVELRVEPRELKSKNTLKTLRKEGKVPGVFYGHGEKTTHVAVNAKEFDKFLHSGVGKNVLIDLNIEGNKKTVIIKELQRNLLDHTLSHVDFMAVSMKQKIEINVPLHIVGVAPGVKDAGGILEYTVRELKVKCLPTDIPAYIDIDVSNLQIGNGVSVKDLPKIEGVEVLNDPNSLLVNVVAPMKIEEVAPVAAEAGVEGAAAAAAPMEPEVISKGKKDKEEEGAEAAPAPKEKEQKK
ncbi:MAG: 50S ribosomal protein L25 [Elusimicrobia bacterium]|nr:50S ribosomal protein L25 [Candidatus Liberimonas magnetica]